MSSSLTDAVPLSEIRRVLVTKLRHHGDVLLASPVFSALKQAAPQAEIDALVYRETAPMLANHPAVARIHAIDREWKRRGVAVQLAEEWRLQRALRARRYDLLIHLTEHPRGLALAMLLNPRYAVTRERAAGAWFWRSRYTHFYRLPKATPRHAVEANLDALRRIGIQPDSASRRLVLVPGADAEAKVDALLAHHRLAPRGFVQAHPGSRWMFKCWSADRTAALYDRIAADGHRLVVTGAPDPRERELVESILAAVSPRTTANIVDLTGKLALSELAALTARARAFVGVDTAPMHIAAAMGTPTLALFGPSGEHEWGPWMVASRVVVSTAHPCRPCGIDGCGGGKISECLTTLAVDDVHAQFAALLAETGARAARAP
ncbi:MAG: putative lipopolysaccharide heptosyltransferase III [Betaproteobacteria bacterium]|nr:putative lipopolysaccharide heptosyltransferase III [Betaproteobacteria bacterium]